MNSTVDKEISAALFRLRWAFMSKRKRYVYLWKRTREGQQTNFDRALGRFKKL